MSGPQLSHKQRPSPVDGGVCPNGRNGGPHVLQIPDLDGAVITARDDIIPDGEHGGGHGATRKVQGQSRGCAPEAAERGLARLSAHGHGGGGGR